MVMTETTPGNWNKENDSDSTTNNPINRTLCTRSTLKARFLSIFKGFSEFLLFLDVAIESFTVRLNIAVCKNFKQKCSMLKSILLIGKSSLISPPLLYYNAIQNLLNDLI